MKLCGIPLITILNHRPSLLKTYRAVNFQILTRIPGSFLKNRKPANESFCKFNYGLPGNFDVSEEKLHYTPESGEKSSYRILYNVVESSFAKLVPLTYVTHSSPEFFIYLSEVVTHWEGPISIAVFVPDSDADVIIQQLFLLCHCLSDMSKVSLHFVFPIKDPPFIATPLTKHSNTCSLKDTSSQQSYRTRNRLSYPVNVCRNAAKIASNTHYVLVSDVELVPSEHLASRFLKMIEKVPKRLTNPSIVYVVPVFEIERYEEIPRSKNKLLDLIKDERAVYFHRHLCFHCQKFPGLQNWLQDDPGDIVKPLLSVKREYPFHRWEPIYIGTKSDPYYSEVLTWEGKQDKMTQMLEMCLIGYKFVILDGAFLVHWPGIKRKSMDMRIRNRWRSPYLLQNSRQYSFIINKLFNKYSKNPKC
ncbi:hypothetical protein Trydic_g7509 [Trypoxylus dichotomus]